MSIEENIFIAKRNIVDYIWKSANLEGIAVTYPQTQIIFDGLSVANFKINDINAIVNLKNAWKFVLENIDYPLDFRYLSQINKLIGDYDIVLFAGKLRNSDVAMGGTKWKPELPNIEKIEDSIKEINTIENITDRALTATLYLMRTQPFFDGNKRTAMLAGNQIMIQNGKGIISIPLEHQERFREMLIEYYETNNMDNIKEFLYENCIDGIEFKKEFKKQETIER
ncbi:Fic family protein [Campylobacter fetus]|nr:Fic family protein [Campylobacter fetus]